MASNQMGSDQLGSDPNYGSDPGIPAISARRRWALVLMGAWMAGTICMSVVATENFYTVDHLLERPASSAFSGMVQKLGRAETRELLRYLSSELNRLYFQMWNVTQLVLGVLVLWLISRGQTRARGQTRTSGLTPIPTPAWGIVSMLAIVVSMLVYFTPAIVSLGRSLDFVPRDPSPPGLQRFWILHAAYTTLEMIKLLVGGVVTFRLARRSSASAFPSADLRTGSRTSRT